jgi:hypothetical protein
MPGGRTQSKSHSDLQAAAAVAKKEILPGPALCSSSPLKSESSNPPTCQLLTAAIAPPPRLHSPNSPSATAQHQHTATVKRGGGGGRKQMRAWHPRACLPACACGQGFQLRSSAAWCVCVYGVACCNTATISWRQIGWLFNKQVQLCAEKHSPLYQK